MNNSFSHCHHVDLPIAKLRELAISEGLTSLSGQVNRNMSDYLEFWCHERCQMNYWVVRNPNEVGLRIYFMDNRDAVMFKLVFG